MNRLLHAWERMGPWRIASLAVFFFFAYSVLIFANTDHRYTWPDEMANYHVIRQFIADGRLRIDQPLLDVSKELTHPRSTNVFSGAIVPGGFAGFPLLYGLAGIVVRGFFVFLTPLLAALGGIALFQIVRRYFDERIAWISALLYFVSPGIWYYASFAMLPNMAFVSLVLLGVWGICGQTQRVMGAWFFGCLGIVLAASMRPNELVWVLPLCAAAVWPRRAALTWKHGAAAVIAATLIALPNMYISRATFGSWLGSGYVSLASGALPTEASARAWWSAALLPFGVHPIRALRNIWTYVIVPQWWIFVFAGYGLLRGRRAGYAAAALLLCAYLSVYYGSWQFEDTVTLKIGALGVSYVRYLLPALIILLPAAAEGVLMAGTLLGRFRSAAVSLMLVAAVIASTFVVWFAYPDSLAKIMSTYREYAATARTVFGLTDPRGVIVTERADKIFWPDRAVVSKWGAADVYKLQALAIADIPLYFFGLEPETAIAYLNTRLLAPYELRIDPAVLTPTPNGALYVIRYEPTQPLVR